MSPCARWPLLFFASPACIFYSVSPPTCSSRRWRRRICHRVPAGRCRSSSRRRVFFIANPRRHDRFAAWGVEYVSVCPLALAVLRLTGVHFLFCFPTDMFVSPLETENMPPCARWSLPLLASPACIFIANPRRHARLAAWGLEYAPCARWSLPLLASPACIFHRESPPA